MHAIPVHPVFYNSVTGLLNASLTDVRLTAPAHIRTCVKMVADGLAMQGEFLPATVRQQICEDLLAHQREAMQGNDPAFLRWPEKPVREVLLASHG